MNLCLRILVTLMSFFVASSIVMAEQSPLGDFYRRHIDEIKQFSISPTPIRVVLSRHDENSIVEADQEAFRLAKKLHLNAIDPFASPLLAADKTIHQLRIYGGLSSAFIVESTSIVVINEQLVGLLAPEGKTDLFRKYQLLHEALGHGNLIQFDKASEVLRSVLSSSCPEQSDLHPNLIPAHGTTSVFHESYADAQAVVITTVAHGVAAGSEMLDLIRAFRAKTKQPISNDSHDTSHTLTELGLWLGRWDIDSQIDSIRTSSAQKLPQSLHQLSLTFSLKGTARWLSSELGFGMEMQERCLSAIQSFYDSKMSGHELLPQGIDWEFQPKPIVES